MSAGAFPLAPVAGSRVRRQPLRKARLAIGAVISAAFRPHKAALSNLVAMPLTVTAFGCFAAAAFLWAVIPGLAVTGAALFVLEHMIADEL